MVARKENQRVGGETPTLHGGHDLAYAPVDLRDRIAGISEPGFAEKACRGAGGIVRIRKREIHEKWIVRARLIEILHRFLGIAHCQQIAIGILLQDRFIPHQRKRLHVHAVRNAIVGIKAAAGRQICRLMTQVPLANCFRLVPTVMKEIGKQRFIQRRSGFGTWAEGPGGVAAQSISTGKHGGPGSGAYGMG